MNQGLDRILDVNQPITIRMLAVGVRPAAAEPDPISPAQPRKNNSKSNPNVSTAVRLLQTMLLLDIVRS